MTEQTECRWIWCKPDKPGLWWYRKDWHLIPGIVSVLKPERYGEQWYAYIGPIPPEPLPPKRKVTQTLWMVPKTMWAGGTVEELWYSADWLSPDGTIPPGAIETVQKREVEL